LGEHRCVKAANQGGRRIATSLAAETSQQGHDAHGDPVHRLNRLSGGDG